MKNFAASFLIGEPLIFLKGAIIFILGPINAQLAYLLLAVAIDIVFGVQLAVRQKEFSIKTLFVKVYRKLIVYALWLSMFNAFDMVAGLPNTARWALIVMLVGMELLSAAKNTAKLGHGKLSDAIEHVYLTLIKTNPALSKPKIDTDEIKSGGQEGEELNEDRAQKESK